LIIPTILKPPELAAIRERVQELIIFWSKYYMFETIADMPQYVQDAAALLGHIDALEIDKEQPNGSNVPGQEIPAGSDS
jgi:hypothetical protein